MKINSISNNPQCSFGSFNVVDCGAQRLAAEFMKNPDLEAKFMLNIVKPLEESDGKVLYDGNLTYYKHPQENQAWKIQYSQNDKNALAVVKEIDKNDSKTYYKVSNNRPTHIFKNSYPLNEIEAAKNIILDKDCFYDKIAAELYTEAHKNETFEEKTARLEKRFSINA